VDFRPNWQRPLKMAQIAFDQNRFDGSNSHRPTRRGLNRWRIISGGETSRLMLGRKMCSLGRRGAIFDFRRNRSGYRRAGRMTVGQKLWNLSRMHQVFCVTHLPQLAAFGDEHYQVQKLIQGNRTLTQVERLDGEPRLLELSQMLGEVGEGTLRSAHELMQVARQMIKER
jgi:DNA repair protein RecN (Recombination protein N)